MAPNQSSPSIDRYTFTVFTAVYNSGDKLERVYRSLANQTYRDFEWLIVDDGSTDGTRERIQQWQREVSFPIRYIYQENQGKHAAFNLGVSLASGELFLNLDHDDACVAGALERFKHHWDAIPSEARANFSAVTALCVDERGRLVGTRFPSNVIDSDTLEIRHRFHVKGEKWGFHRTAVLRDFPFPKLNRTEFASAGAIWIPESIVWNAIARKFRTRYVNETLRIFYSHDANQASRLSQGTHAKHVLGGRLVCADGLNNDLGWLRFAPVTFFKFAANYGRWSFHCDIPLADQWGELRSIAARVLWLAMLPLAYALFWRDRRKDEGLKTLATQVAKTS